MKKFDRSAITLSIVTSVIAMIFSVSVLIYVVGSTILSDASDGWCPSFGIEPIGNGGNAVLH